jgi:peroxiredoxin
MSYIFWTSGRKGMDCDQNMLTLGSDDEQAMRKAMINFFPSAQTVVCLKHLRDYFIRDIDELFGKKLTKTEHCLPLFVS